MSNRLCTSEEFEAFEKLCLPSIVDERLRREVPQSPWSGLSGNAFLLSDLLKLSPEDVTRKELEVMSVIWKEIEDLNYSKALTANFYYHTASQSFEKRLKAHDDREKFQRRVWFRYITGMAIYLLGNSQSPVRLRPDKETARRVRKHIQALLADLLNPEEYALWGDYDLVQKLKELRKKMEASDSVRRVENTLSPEGYFAFYLAQRFLFRFGETMPSIVADLCRAIGKTPDESTVQRWTASAEQHHSEKR